MWQPPASCIGSIFNSRKHCYHTFNWQKLLFFLQLELYTLGTSGSVGNGWNWDECMTDSPFPPNPVRSSNSSRNDHMGGKQFLPVSKWFRHCEVLSTNNTLAMFTSLSVQAMHDNLSSTTLQNIYDSKFKGWKLLRLHFLFGVLPNAIFNTSFLPCHLSFSSTVLLIPLSSSSRTFAHFSFCIFLKKKLWIVGIKLLFHLCVWFYRHPHHLKMQQ